MKMICTNPGTYNVEGCKTVLGLVVLVPQSQLHVGLCGRKAPLKWNLELLDVPKLFLLPPKR